MFLWKLYSLIPVTQTILYHPLNHQLHPVLFLPAGTLPPGLVTDIPGYLQKETVTLVPSDAPRRLLPNDPNTDHILCDLQSLVRTSSIVTSSTLLLSVFSSARLCL